MEFFSLTRNGRIKYPLGNSKPVAMNKMLNRFLIVAVNSCHRRRHLFLDLRIPRKEEKQCCYNRRFIATTKPETMNQQYALSEKIVEIISTHKGSGAEELLDKLGFVSSRAVIKALKDVEADAATAFGLFLWSTKKSHLRHASDLRDTVIDTLKKNQTFETAWEVLRQRKNNVDCWVFYVLMKAYKGAGMMEKAVETFDLMEGEFSCKPDIIVLNTLLHVLVSSVGIELANVVYRERMLKDLKPSRSTFNVLLHGHCKKGKVKDALKLFDEMSVMGISPDTRTFTIVLDGLFHAGMVEQAGKLFESMATYGCTPDQASYYVMVHGYCRAGDLSRALEMFESLKADGFVPSDYCYGYLIDGFSRAGRFEEVFDRFGDYFSAKRSPGLSSSTAILNAFCNARRIKDAFMWLGSMMGKNCFPNTVCYNAMLRGLCKVGLGREAHALLFKMQSHGCQSNVLSHNAVIDGLCNAGLVDDAYRVFEGMREKKLSPTIATYNSLIAGLCQAGDMDKALILFHKMEIGDNSTLYLSLMTQGSGDRPMNKSSFEDLSVRLCNSGKLLKAFRIGNRLIESKIAPNEITYNTLLGGLCRVKKIDEALRLFKLMFIRGYVHNAVPYCILINHLQRAKRVDDAFLLFVHMMQKRIRATPGTYQMLVSLMAAFCEEGLVLKSFQLWVSHVSQSTSLDFEKLSQLQKIFDHGNIVDDFATVLKMYTEKHKVQPQAYSVIIEGLCNTGKTRDALKLMSIVVEEDLPLSKAICKLVIRWVCNQKKPLVALECDGKSKKIALLSNTGVFKGLVTCLYNFKKEEDALGLVKVADSQGLLCRSTIYDFLICLLCSNENPLQALKLCRDSIYRGLFLELKTFYTLVSSLCKIGKVEDARRLAKLVEEQDHMHGLL